MHTGLLVLFKNDRHVVDLSTALNISSSVAMRFLKNGIVTCREDHSVGSGRNWIEEATLDGHSDWVRDVAWSPALSLSRQLIASCGQDGRVIIWQSSNSSADQDTSKLDDASSPLTWKMVPLQTYTDVVWHVSWSLTGNILAVSGGDNKVRSSFMVIQKLCLARPLKFMSHLCCKWRVNMARNELKCFSTAKLDS